jgi:hypothetical protein
MDYQDLRVAIADGVAELTLDRPEQRNAFSGPMGASLARAYRECDARDDVKLPKPVAPQHAQHPLNDVHGEYHTDPVRLVRSQAL